MIDRVNRYYQMPASRLLLVHFREQIGLTGDYLRIFDDLRAVLGSSQLHAENVGLPVKTYNAMAGIVSQACVCELIRLAEIGIKTEMMRTDC